MLVLRCINMLLNAEQQGRIKSEKENGYNVTYYRLFIKNDTDVSGVFSSVDIGMAVSGYVREKAFNYQGRFCSVHELRG